MASFSEGFLKVVNASHVPQSVHLATVLHLTVWAVRSSTYCLIALAGHTVQTAIILQRLNAIAVQLIVMNATRKASVKVSTLGGAFNTLWHYAVELEWELLHFICCSPECADYYFLYDDKCVEDCPKGYFINKMQQECVRCHVDCDTCDGPGFDDCEVCRNPKAVRYNGECRAECPEKTYYIRTTRECRGEQTGNLKWFATNQLSQVFLPFTLCCV